jgi:hypothetical protein
MIIEDLPVFATIICLPYSAGGGATKQKTWVFLCCYYSIQEKPKNTKKNPPECTPQNNKGIFLFFFSPRSASLAVTALFAHQTTHSSVRYALFFLGGPSFHLYQKKQGGPFFYLWFAMTRHGMRKGRKKGGERERREEHRER